MKSFPYAVSRKDKCIHFSVSVCNNKQKENPLRQIIFFFFKCTVNIYLILNVPENLYSSTSRSENFISGRLVHVKSTKFCECATKLWPFDCNFIDKRSNSVASMRNGSKPMREFGGKFKISQSSMLGTSGCPVYEIYKIFLLLLFSGNKSQNTHLNYKNKLNFLPKRFSEL